MIFIMESGYKVMCDEKRETFKIILTAIIISLPFLFFLSKYCDLMDNPWVERYIKSELVQIYGDEYKGKEIFEVEADGKKISVKEDMKIFCKAEKVRAWDESMPQYDKNREEFSKMFWVTIYSCSVKYTRRIYVDGKALYGIKLEKTISYNAYEDNSTISGALTVIDESSKNITYMPSEELFEDIETAVKKLFTS